MIETAADLARMIQDHQRAWSCKPGGPGHACQHPVEWAEEFGKAQFASGRKAEWESQQAVPLTGQTSKARLQRTIGFIDPATPWERAVLGLAEVLDTLTARVKFNEKLGDERTEVLDERITTLEIAPNA